MSNEEKCRLIAELEGKECRYCNRTRKDHDKEPWVCVDFAYPDYAHDLNATMRAARRRKDKDLYVSASGHAGFYPTMGDSHYVPDNPAQAACDALAEWIAAHPNDQG